MADFTSLKAMIAQYVKENGAGEITGDILQNVLLNMVVSLGDQAINDLVTALQEETVARQNADGDLSEDLGEEATSREQADNALQNAINGITSNIQNGYVYAGIATPSSTPATGKVFYIALTAGTYTNYGNTEVHQGLNILKYNGSTWVLDTIIGIDNKPTQGSNNLVKSGGVLESVIKDGPAFDLSAYNAQGGVLATYANLSAALTALNALPAAYKNGGMSMKFVQSSDNKYVQYRCMAQNFTTDVTQWQGVDDEPTANSENLVKSRGVYDAVLSVGFNKEYYTPQLSGYINNQNGNFVSGNWGHLSSDYIQVSSDFIIRIAPTATVGAVATKAAYYNSNKEYVENISDGYVVPINGYVRFCCKTDTLTSDTFSIHTPLADEIIKIQSKISDINSFIHRFVISQSTSNGNTEDGMDDWETFVGAKIEFDSEENATIISSEGGSVFAGIRSTILNEHTSIPRAIIFEAKMISGDCSNIGISYAASPLPSANKVSLTEDWKTYVIQFNTDGPAANKRMSFLSYNSSAYSYKIKNIFYADFPDYEYKVISEFGTLIKDIDSLYSLNEEINEELNKRFDFVRDKTDSIKQSHIDNSLSDTGLPSWVGKIEMRQTDLMPSINNAGQAYLINNNGDLELRVVKDAITLVGCTLVQKATNSISSVKSFSMCHFGDSITYGVGSNPNYVQRLKTLLEADGHTITTQTNLGISGTTAEGIYNTYKDTEPVHHDIATYMIGINDQDRWLRVKNPQWQSDGLKANEFREWFRTNLRLSIDTIIRYSTCDKLFLIVPYWSVVEMREGSPYPSEWAYYSQPLQNIIIQEFIDAANDYDISWLCRGDYYVPNSYSCIPDGLHANNTGAELLAKGLRDEITFRV